MKVREVQVMAAGMGQDLKGMGVAFQEFVQAAFPFSKDMRTQKDQELVDTMKKEVAKGPISFGVMNVNPLKKAAEKARLPDDFREKLRNRKKKAE
jgi:hypothetical protein